MVGIWLKVKSQCDEETKGTKSSLCSGAEYGGLLLSGALCTVGRNVWPSKSSTMLLAFGGGTREKGWQVPYDIQDSLTGNTCPHLV